MIFADIGDLLFRSTFGLIDKIYYTNLLTPYFSLAKMQTIYTRLHHMDKKDNK